MLLQFESMQFLGLDEILPELFYDLRGFSALHLHLELGLMLPRLLLRECTSEMLHKQRLFFRLSAQAVLHLQRQPEHFLHVFAHASQALAHTSLHLVVLRLSLALAPLELCAFPPPRFLLSLVCSPRRVDIERERSHSFEHPLAHFAHLLHAAGGFRELDVVPDAQL